MSYTTGLAHLGPRDPLAEILRQEIPVGLNRTTPGIRKSKKLLLKADERVYLLVNGIECEKQKETIALKI
jgi:hypothetical protein